MKWYLLTLIIIGSLALALFIFLKVADLFLGKKPLNLGPKNGILAPMKKTPKGVNSYTEYKPQKMKPIQYFGDTITAVMQMVDILRNLEKYPRITFYEIDYNYIWARDISKFWKWKDDIEFLFNEADHLIQFRSSPRYGTTDGCFNRRRMEIILHEFEKINQNL